MNQQAAENVALFTRPTLAAISPTSPQSVKRASLPREAPFPMHRSRIPLKNRERSDV